MPSPLYEAIKAGDSAKALELIQSGKEDVNARGSDGPAPEEGGATCLIAAIKNFDIDPQVVFALIEKADPNLGDTLDQETPLMWVARQYPYKSPGDTFIKALLKRGANPEQKNKYGDTALHVAASCGAALQAAVLIRLGANAKAKDAKGKLAVDIAQDVATQSSIEETMNSM
jgi:ankyrin repeat protein